MFEPRRPAPARTAILGWGSLLWDGSPAFDEQHGDWQLDGPQLPLEFSRVSQRRNGALTLVIDAAHGVPCRVAHAVSRRPDPEAAITDLRNREGTNQSHIGFLLADGTRMRARDAHACEVIRNWARVKGYDAVVWTDLPANFQEQWGEPFRAESALEYLLSLEPEARTEAARYVRRAPPFVDTPLRRLLQDQSWFGGAS